MHKKFHIFSQKLANTPIMSLYFIEFIADFTQSNKTAVQNCQLLSSANQSKSSYKQNNTYLICDHTNDSQKTARFIQMHRVQSSEDVELLLDNVNWKILIFTCSNNNLNAFTNFFGQNHTSISNYERCGFTDDRAEIFQFMPDCFKNVHENYLQEAGAIIWLPFLVLGLLCILGNLIIACQKIVLIFFKNNEKKEQLIYRFLVFNLAISDVLMGVYILTVAVDIRVKGINKEYFTENFLCNFLGVISFLSCQMSLTILVIISGYRFYAIAYPYNQVRFKTVCLIVSVIWVVWIVLTVVPLIEIDPFFDTFNWGIRRSRLYPDSNNSVIFHNQYHLLQNLQDLAESQKQDLYFVIKAVFHHRTVNISVKALKKFGIIDATFENAFYFGFYNSQYLCSRTFLVRLDGKADIFIITIIAYDFFCSVFLLIAYAKITLYLTNNCKIFKCFPRSKKQNSNHDKRVSSLTVSEIPGRSNENHHAFQRISLIIATNLFCWIPLCLISLSVWIVFRHSHNICEYFSVFRRVQLTVFCMIPINSIINPYIYSWHSWKHILYSIKKKFFSFVNRQ